ncbi:hypothetical protein [Rhizobium sp. RAF56]|uniref:hypothetical protein n=1 Tax=Rhizobium sp. RAF56 TaxID=3233062 RepID=UPI003F956F86
MRATAKEERLITMVRDPGNVHSTERWREVFKPVIAHARYTVFQMAEVAVPRDLFRRILGPDR